RETLPPRSSGTGSSGVPLCVPPASQGPVVCGPQGVGEDSAQFLGGRPSSNPHSQGDLSYRFRRCPSSNGFVPTCRKSLAEAERVGPFCLCSKVLFVEPAVFTELVP